MAIDFTGGGVQTTDTYTAIITKLQGIQQAAICWMDPAVVSHSGIPHTGAYRMLSGNLQKFNGTAWVDQAINGLSQFGGTPAVAHATVPKFAFYVGSTERGYLSYAESTADLRLDSDGQLAFASNNIVRGYLTSGGRWDFNAPSDGSTTARIFAGTANTNLDLHGSSAGAIAQVRFIDSSNTTVWGLLTSSNAGGIDLAAQGARGLTFGTNGATRLTIDSAGNSLFSRDVYVGGTGNIRGLAATGLLYTGVAGSGTGGNVRYYSDDGVMRWAAGILGAVGDKNWSLYDLVAGATRYNVNATGNHVFYGASTGYTVQVNGTVQAQLASTTDGFQTTTYAVNARNRIWSFGNADGFGLSYFQGTAGFSGQDSIGVHLGTATVAGSTWTFNMADSSFRSGGPVTAGGIELGYRDIPAISTTGTTLAAGDKSKMYVSTGAMTAPSGMTAGNTFVVYNNSATSFAINQGAGLTLRQAGTGNTGGRTLAPRGVATITYVGANEAFITGAGLS